MLPEGASVVPFVKRQVSLRELGVDGLSRGNMGEGIMKDPDIFLKDVPLNLGLHERSPEMVKWLCNVFGINLDDVLEPSD